MTPTITKAWRMFNAIPIGLTICAYCAGLAFFTWYESYIGNKVGFNLTTLIIILLIVLPIPTMIYMALSISSIFRTGTISRKLLYIFFFLYEVASLFFYYVILSVGIEQVELIIPLPFIWIPGVGMLSSATLEIVAFRVSRFKPLS